MTKLILVKQEDNLSTTYFKDSYENDFYKVAIVGDSEGVTHMRIRKKNVDAPEIKVTSDDDFNFTFDIAYAREHSLLKIACQTVEQIEKIIKG